MDMNESGEKGMEGNASSGAVGIPVEWQTQFSAAAFSCAPPPPQVPMMDSAFASAGLWASTSQAMLLSNVSAMSTARGGGSFLAPVLGFLPQGLGHFPVDSGFIERAARASCFGGGGVMGTTAGFGATDHQPMNNAFSSSLESPLDHQRKDDNENGRARARPERPRRGAGEGSACVRAA